MEEDWFQADLAARAGLKFSSVFLLAAEALRRAHLQVPGDDIQFSRAEVGQLVFLLGPLARLVYDQFARVALKAVKVRRANVLDTFQWPSVEARNRLEQLPVASPDLITGQFLEKFAQEGAMNAGKDLFDLDLELSSRIVDIAMSVNGGEVAREKKFYETFGKKEPEDKEDEDTKKNEEIRKDDNDYHRNDEQVKICLECCNSQLSQLRKKYIRISSQATVMHVKKFLAKKLRIELNKLDLLCNEEILEKDNTLKSVSLTNWRDRVRKMGWLAQGMSCPSFLLITFMWLSF
ncbi:Polycomb group RING finger protein 3 [Holothuria leucospilota]|uniref:Polycomb group RING finger protein 3 n=1 Tax=Holothuria leucospilota TaxID=206669 RepID=A0A9Q0YPC7_HOLLE|nr:Polycomb group RING finger protein 3 [Holothuria leucospilota]